MVPCIMLFSQWGRNLTGQLAQPTASLLWSREVLFFTFASKNTVLIEDYFLSRHAMMGRFLPVSVSHVPRRCYLKPGLYCGRLPDGRQTSHRCQCS